MIKITIEGTEENEKALTFRLLKCFLTLRAYSVWRKDKADDVHFVSQVNDKPKTVHLVVKQED